MKQIIGSKIGSKKALKNTSPNENSESHWVSMSDLMAGLMMVFLFISIAYMQQAQKEASLIKEVAVAYQKSQVALYEQLYDEFKGDLDEWDAEIDKTTLEFRFKSPEVLFDVGKNSLKPEFEMILKDFFPRYLSVIKNFKKDITEIRIEGHTSSQWNRYVTGEKAYFNNMELSQGRTRSVLEFIYLLPAVAVERQWVKSKFAAVGLSSSNLIYKDENKTIEDIERSRRVTFRVITNAETQIRKIIEN